MGITPADSLITQGVGETSSDLASAVVTGEITAVGPTDLFLFWGPFNLLVYGLAGAGAASGGATLTTTAGSSAATVSSATGVAAGMAINSANVPVGTTIGALSGTNVTLAFPPGESAAEVLGGTDNNVVFTGNGPWNATLRLERSPDGGASWVVCGLGGGGTQAVYNTPNQDVSVVFGEPEMGNCYRINCTAYTSGVIKYRLSGNSQAVRTMSVPSVT